MSRMVLIAAVLVWGLFSAAVRAEDTLPESSSIAPRRPEIPAAPAGSNLASPVDLLLAPYFAAHGIEPGAPIDDRRFARRVYLDCIGLLPSAAEIDAFLADARPDKRAVLVDRLLADERRYAEHWLSFWNDALRNDYKGTGYIDGGRAQITGWLYQALASNMPYDQFVRELIDPSPESAGFIKGIVWRGVVNASQVPEVQAAQNVSQVFMGINLKCASCHDSFINDWKLADAYALAGVFADAPLEMHRCDKPIGEFAPLGFLYRDLGEIEAAAPRAERLKQLAAIITNPANGRLTRTMVNRLWARFLGRGLVEPVDEMDHPPWNADLLDWLAVDLADQGYDLKHTIRRILTSRAYSLSAVGASPPDAKPADYVFAGPSVRRMSAEQYVDAVASLTGTAYQKSDAALSAPGGPVVAAKWIWNDAQAGAADPGGRIFLRKAFHLTAVPREAVAVATADNEFTLWINGRQVAASADWAKPAGVDIAPYLVPGENVLAVEAINWPDPETGKGLEIQGANPAGFVLIARGRAGGSPEEPVAAWEVVSDASWLWTKKAADGWQAARFDTTGWQHVVELAPIEGGPWNLAAGLQAALDGTSSGGVRASLVAADPLLTALGRPNREQVVTARSTIATTLEALELTNGGNLAERLRLGTAQRLAPAPSSADALIEQVYVEALGRGPTPEERSAAQEITGSPPTAEGVEDLLWVVLMLPEFQLIY